MKQKILVNGQLFELSEAYGLNSNRTDETDSKECVICLVNRKDTLLNPCKHVSMCRTCAQIVLKSDRKCPVCRTSKANTSLIYDL